MSTLLVCDGCDRPAPAGYAPEKDGRCGWLGCNGYYRETDIPPAPPSRAAPPLCPTCGSAPGEARSPGAHEAIERQQANTLQALFAELRMHTKLQQRSGGGMWEAPFGDRENSGGTPVEAAAMALVGWGLAAEDRGARAALLNAASALAATPAGGVGHSDVVKWLLDRAVKGPR